MIMPRISVVTVHLFRSTTFHIFDFVSCFYPSSLSRLSRLRPFHVWIFLCRPTSALDVLVLVAVAVAVARAAATMPPWCTGWPPLWLSVGI